MYTEWTNGDTTRLLLQEAPAQLPPPPPFAPFSQSATSAQNSAIASSRGVLRGDDAGHLLRQRGNTSKEMTSRWSLPILGR